MATEEQHHPEKHERMQAHASKKVTGARASAITGATVVAPKQPWRPNRRRTGGCVSARNGPWASGQFGHAAES